MKRTLPRLSVLTVLVLLLAGCASSLTGDSYSRGEARQTTTIRKGVVESVRYVKLEGTKSGVGAAAGGAVGGVAGSAVGSNRTTSSIGAVLGAVTGGLLGAAAEEGVTRQQGIEITVQLDDGSLLAVVQEANEDFAPGQKVRLLKTGGTTRVSKAPQ